VSEALNASVCVAEKYECALSARGCAPVAGVASLLQALQALQACCRRYRRCKPVAGVAGVASLLQALRACCRRCNTAAPVAGVAAKKKCSGVGSLLYLLYLLYRRDAVVLMRETDAYTCARAGGPSGRLCMGP
jgi:hypothetical protein